MLNTFRKIIIRMALPILLFGFAAIGMASTHTRIDPGSSSKQPSSLTNWIRHELVMLPNYGVFDDLGFTIDDNNTVILTGQVVRPYLKREAESAVNRIQGITKLVDNIEVLPLSPFDDHIRLLTYRAIFSRNGFEKYENQALSPIRIIVKNGSITLKGVVGSQMDKTLAEMAARLVPGAFSVTDNLTID